MLLSNMRPNATIDVFTELGLRDIDLNYNWTSNARLHYSDINIADLPNFIQQAQELGVINTNKSTNCVVNYQLLNDNQKKIFKRIESHYSTLITDSVNVEPLRLIIMGITKMGKSYLIHAICERLYEITRTHNV